MQQLPDVYPEPSAPKSLEQLPTAEYLASPQHSPHALASDAARLLVDNQVLIERNEDQKSRLAEAQSEIDILRLERDALLLEKTALHTQHTAASQKLEDAKQTIDSLRQDIQIDPLTRVLSRAGLAEAYTNLQEKNMKRRRSDDKITTGAILGLDLNDFSKKNTELGHIGGDALLAGLGTVLNASIRQGDSAGRQGGDEFMILLEDIDKEQVIEKAMMLRDTILEQLGISASIGIAPLDLSADFDFNADEADIAMYCAKKAKNASSAGAFAYKLPGKEPVLILTAQS